MKVMRMPSNEDVIRQFAEHGSLPVWSRRMAYAGGVIFSYSLPLAYWKGGVVRVVVGGEQLSKTSARHLDRLVKAVGSCGTRMIATNELPNQGD